MSKLIHQEGVIISQTEHSVHLVLECKSACAACHAKSACSSFDQQEKFMDIPYDGPLKFEKGEKVLVTMSSQLGLKAVFYAYFLPFLIFILSLLISFQILHHELVSAIISLILILLYYIFLFIMRTKLSNSFTFVLEKI